MSDLAQRTAAQQAKLIRTRKASAVEVVKAALTRISLLNDRLNAFITVLEEDAVRAAREADRAVMAGEALGSLHGVPVGLKDNYETRGVRTTGGSRVLEDYIPDRDATVVERLRLAGAIIIGKTHLSEFACGAPAVFGELRNPWDPRRLSGMSSGGSAAAVASGMCPIAMGHDTGGSTRIPASYSGVVGMITTYGRVSLYGILPTAWSLDNAGPLAATVEDMAITLSAIAGHDPKDPSSSKERVPNYRRALGGGVRGLRIGIPKEWFFDLVDSEVASAVQGAIRVLESLGASTRQVSIPLAAESGAIGGAIIGPELVAYHEDFLKEHPEKYGPQMLQRLRSAQQITAVQYVKALRLRPHIRGQFLQALEQVDVLVTPTTPVPALPLPIPPLDAPGYASIDGKPISFGYAMSAFTMPFNVAALPTISVPCGFTNAGLPIGLQIAGRPFDEATVLKVAFAYEQNTPWRQRKPPL